MRPSAKLRALRTPHITRSKAASASASATASRSWRRTPTRNRSTTSLRSTSRDRRRSRSRERTIWRRIRPIWRPSAGDRCSIRGIGWCSAISGAFPSGGRPTPGISMRFGNWQLNGIVTLQSGTPFTVFDSRTFRCRAARRRFPGSPATGRTWSGTRTRAAHATGVVQHSRVPAHHARSEFAGAAIRQRGTQCSAGSGIHELGLSRRSRISA